MGHPRGPYVIVDGQGQVVGELGSGLLIQRGGGEAYENGGFWRARDDKYDARFPEPPTYTRVYVRALRECRSTYGMPHYVEYGGKVERGLCDQCREYEREDREARAEAAR